MKDQPRPTRMINSPERRVACSISLPLEVWGRIDRYAVKAGYTNRSRCIERMCDAVLRTLEAEGKL